MVAPKPLISIIIPTFNSAGTLSKCLESITMQVFRNMEIIIQDGYSTDDTFEIVSNYISRYPAISIKWTSEKDNGIYDAINKSLKKASGQFVYFLGSDDSLYDKNVLSEIFDNPSILENDVIYGNVFSTRFNGIYGGEFTEDRILNDNICHQGIFFKRSIFDKVGLYDTRYKSLADWDHNFKWFFDATIKKLFVDITIADYADGGFSSVKFDWTFEKERIIKYFSLRKSTLPLAIKVRYYISAIKTALKLKDFIHLQKVLSKMSVILFHA